MPIQNLLKSQSNEIYTAIVESGWIISRFQWIDVKSPNYSSSLMSPKLEHKVSKFYYIFDHPGEFHYSYSPAQQKLEQRGNSISWSNQLEFFKDWLALLSREVNAPDL